MQRFQLIRRNHHFDANSQELWSSRARELVSAGGGRGWRAQLTYRVLHTQYTATATVLLVLLLLILSFWVSYYLKVRRIKSIHETIVALMAGGVVGLIVKLSPGTVVQNMISFSGCNIQRR